MLRNGWLEKPNESSGDRVEVAAMATFVPYTNTFCISLAIGLS